MNFRSLAVSLAFLASATAPVSARVPKVQLDQVVNSLSVSGTIEVDEQGKVSGHAIKDADAYDQAVRELLDRNIARWTFKPVLIDGVARRARFDMYLRLEAKPLDDKRFEVTIASAAFGNKDKAATQAQVASRDRFAPTYPTTENYLGVGGTVVTVLKIGRDGKVEDVLVEQTNLKAVGTAGAMKQWRADLERVSVAAARQWTFDIPTTGSRADWPYWCMRVPFTFIPYGASEKSKPGQWESYVPGPRQAVKWALDGEKPDQNADALPGGRAFPLKQPLHLLTALNPE